MLQQSKNVLDSHSKKLIYFGHIHSHLTYGLVNWVSLITNRDFDKLQKLQNQCVRLIDPKSNINQIYKKNQILKIKDLIKLELSSLLPAQMSYNWVYFFISSGNSLCRVIGVITRGCCSNRVITPRQ